MGMLSGAYTDYSYNAGNRYSRYSSGSSSYGTSARVNPTTATRSKIIQTARDVAQGYSSHLAEIEYYLRNGGDVDAAIALRTDVFNDIKNTLASDYNINLSDRQIQAILDQAYTSINDETTLQSIEENTEGSFMTGIKQAVPIFGLLANSNSKAETVAKLSGNKVSKKEAAKEALGKYTPGTLAIVAGGAAIIAGLVVSGFTAPVLAPIAVVAGGISIGQNLIKDGIS